MCERCDEPTANCTLHWANTKKEKVCEKCFEKELKQRFGENVDISAFILQPA